MSPPSDDPRVRAHLAAVAGALGGDPSAPAVLDHLRSHIAEALERRAGEADPVAAVLAELDPPAAYASMQEREPKHRLGWWAFLASLAGPVTGLAVGLASGSGELGWLTYTAVELGACAAGLVAWRQPWGRAAVACSAGIYALLLLLSRMS